MNLFFTAFISSMLVKFLPPALRAPVDESRRLEEKMRSMDNRTLIVFDLNMRRPSNDAILPETARAARGQLLERLRSDERAQAVLEVLAPTLEEALGEALDRAKETGRAAHFFDVASALTADDSPKSYGKILGSFFTANAQDVFDLAPSTEQLKLLGSAIDSREAYTKILEWGLDRSESPADLLAFFQGIATDRESPSYLSAFNGFFSARFEDIWALGFSVEDVGQWKHHVHGPRARVLFLERGLEEARRASDFMALFDAIYTNGRLPRQGGRSGWYRSDVDRDGHDKSHRAAVADFLLARLDDIRKLDPSVEEIARLDAYANDIALSRKILNGALDEAESAADFLSVFKALIKYKDESFRRNLYRDPVNARSSDIWGLNPSIAEVKSLDFYAPSWDLNHPKFLKEGMLRAKTADTFFALLDILGKLSYSYGLKEDLDRFLTDNVEAIFKFDLSFGQMETMSSYVTSPSLLAILRRRQEVRLLGSDCLSGTTELIEAGK